MDDPSNAQSTADFPGERSGQPQKKRYGTYQRQALSCLQCRARKVKCDRTKPCSACCLRGCPTECEFIVTVGPAGSDSYPIKQAKEIERLRAENLNLKRRLKERGERVLANEAVSSSGEDDSHRRGSNVNRRYAVSSGLKPTVHKRIEPPDNIYFGSPGMANIIRDFERLQMGDKSQSLSYSMPRGAGIYSVSEPTTYPFPTLWQAFPPVCVPELVLKCLPDDEDVFEYLAAFQKRAQTCAFPHVPEEITEKEVERFLLDRVNNAQKFPDMLALILAALALGANNGAFDKLGGKWVAEGMREERSKGDVWLAASMQALRTCSFMSRPTLLGLQATLMMCPYLTNSGRFLDAWTLLGTIIRLAHSLGLHRNPKFLDPTPPSRECRIRQALWWWILHLDQQYSTTLGRPLGISGIGDCPPPEQLTKSNTILRFGEYLNKFTILARQILSSDRLSNSKIDEFTDRLNNLWVKLPQVLQFDGSWLDKSRELPDWPLDALAAVLYGRTHNYIVLLNRQRLENHPDRSEKPQVQVPSSEPSASSYTHSSQQQVHKSGHTAQSSDSQASRGRPLVISSCLALLTPLLYFYHRIPAALMSWTMGQLAFNASMILILDALETRNLENIWKVELTYTVFCELDEKGVHKLAGLAKSWISRGLESIRRMVTDMEREEAAARAALFPQEIQEQSNMDREPDELMDMEGPLPPLIPPMDTVMGNTGMFLLEDPGLQSFSSEGFMPLAWNMAGSDLDVDPSRNRPFRHYKHSFPTASGLQTIDLTADSSPQPPTQEEKAAMASEGLFAASVQYPPELADAVPIIDAGIVESSSGINPGWVARGIRSPHWPENPEKTGWLDEDYM